MDYLAQSDICATVRFILLKFATKLRDKVEAKVKEKYGFGLKDQRITERYPKLLTLKTNVNIRALINMVLEDFPLYVSSNNPCKL